AGCSGPWSASEVMTFGERGEPAEAQVDPSGNTYVRFVEATKGAAFLAGCPQLLGGIPSTATGWFLAKYDPTGSCLWSRWIEAYIEPSSYEPRSHRIAVTSSAVAVAVGSVLVFSPEGAPLGKFEMGTQVVAVGDELVSSANMLSGAASATGMFFAHLD